MEWPAVATGVVCIIVTILVATAGIYVCSGAWKLWLRIRQVESRLAEVDLKIIALIATLDRQLRLRGERVNRNSDGGEVDRPVDAQDTPPLVHLE